MVTVVDAFVVAIVIVPLVTDLLQDVNETLVPFSAISGSTVPV